MTASQETAAEAPDTGQVGRLLALAIVIGIAAALLATAFTVVVHELEHVLWDVAPQALGWSEPAAWWTVALLLVGAVGTWAATLLPGHGGHHPLDGLALGIGPRQIGSVALAALTSLVFGAVVGPEAPLMALGTATAVFVASRRDPTEQQILMLAGAMAAMGTIFGNPLITAILLLETTALTGGGGTPQAATTKLLPALLALGCGYLVQVGLGPFPGVGESVLTVPGLPAYPDVQIGDLLLSVPLALAVAVVCVAALQLAAWYRSVAAQRPLPAIVAAGLIVAGLAIAVRATTDTSVDMILFSGQSAIPEALGVTATWALLVILVAKALAYAVSIGGGFRGGMIFPGVYLGVVGAVACADLVPGSNLAALAAAGVAAAAAAIIRLPFTAVLLAVLLCSASGLAVTTSAIVGGIVGLLVRLALDARGAPAVDQQPTEAAASGASSPEHR